MTTPTPDQAARTLNRPGHGAPAGQNYTDATPYTIVTGTTPSYVTTPLTMQTIWGIQAAAANYPPPVERITLHPVNTDRLRGLLPTTDTTPGTLGSLLAVPVVTDDAVPPEVMRVRRGGVDTDVPFPVTTTED